MHCINTTLNTDPLFLQNILFIKFKDPVSSLVHSQWVQLLHILMSHFSLFKISTKLFESLNMTLLFPYNLFSLIQPVTYSVSFVRSVIYWLSPARPRGLLLAAQYILYFTPFPHVNFVLRFLKQCDCFNYGVFYRFCATHFLHLPIFSFSLVLMNHLLKVFSDFNVCNLVFTRY